MSEIEHTVVAKIIAPPPPRTCVKQVQCGKLAFSQGNRALFLVQNGSFSAFWHYKNKVRLLRGSDVKCHIPSTCLDASKKWFSIGMYSIKQGFPSGYDWKPKKALKMAKMCTVFQVRTPTCHIVTVSRTYPPPIYFIYLKLVRRGVIYDTVIYLK